MRFKKKLSEEACVALTDIICNYVPDDRTIMRGDLVLLTEFLGNYSDSPDKTASLLRAGLSVKRPKATLNGAISLVRKTLEEEERAPFITDMFNLCMALSGSGSKQRDYSLFVGKVLGVDDIDLQAIAKHAAATVIPKRS